MEIFGAVTPGALELRRTNDGGARITGRFPYNTLAVIHDGGRAGGRPQKERIAAGAFRYRVQDPEKEIHLLLGHDWDHPLASKLTRTLDLTDTDQALTFTARITPEVAETSHGRDALALIASGLAYGVSPGFRIPPPRTVSPEEAESFEDEGTRPDEGAHNARIRTIKQALLYEMSIVTRPAYKESAVDMARAQAALIDPRPALIRHPLNRWRP